jgi:hypothetical protein
MSSPTRLMWWNNVTSSLSLIIRKRTTSFFSYPFQHGLQYLCKNGQVYVEVCLFVCLFIYLFICLFVYLSVYLYIHSFIFIYLFIIFIYVFIYFWLLVSVWT